MTTTKEFREWFDEYCKTENVNKPTQLFVCLEFSIMWEVDMGNIHKAKYKALAECIKFNYATTEQFKTVFDKFINDSRVLAHLTVSQLWVKDRK
jgi:hypothetical protein